MSSKADRNIEDLQARKSELQEKALAQSRRMLWCWGVLAAASLVILVGKVLDFTTDVPVGKRVMLPGIVFIISAIGVSLNRRVVVKAKKENKNGEIS